MSKDWFVSFTSENFKKTTAKILTKSFWWNSMWACDWLVIIVKELTLFWIYHHLLSFNWKLIIEKRSRHGWLRIDGVTIVAESDFSTPRNFSLVAALELCTMVWWGASLRGNQGRTVARKSLIHIRLYTHSDALS